MGIQWRHWHITSYNQAHDIWVGNSTGENHHEPSNLRGNLHLGQFLIISWVANTQGKSHGFCAGAGLKPSAAIAGTGWTDQDWSEHEWWAQTPEASMRYRISCKAHKRCTNCRYKLGARLLHLIFFQSINLAGTDCKSDPLTTLSDELWSSLSFWTWTDRAKNQHVSLLDAGGAPFGYGEELRQDGWGPSFPKRWITLITRPFDPLTHVRLTWSSCFPTKRMFFVFCLFGFGLETPSKGCFVLVLPRVKFDEIHWIYRDFATIPAWNPTRCCAPALKPNNAGICQSGWDVLCLLGPPSMVNRAALTCWDVKHRLKQEVQEVHDVPNITKTLSHWMIMCKYVYDICEHPRFGSQRTAVGGSAGHRDEVFCKNF